MKQAGTGNFTWGYFGGLMDVATGLLYVGGGQYYDPATGRFLTPANREGNPYLPGRVDPLGALLGPAVLAILFVRRKKKISEWDRIVVGMLLVVGMGLGVAACRPSPPTSTPTLPPTLPPPTTCPTPGSNGTSELNPTDPPDPTDPPPPPATYDRNAAVSYAIEWSITEKYNKDKYFLYDNDEGDALGDDCTNFVSQALWAGGIKSVASPKWNGYDAQRKNGNGIPKAFNDGKTEEMLAWIRTPNLFNLLVSAGIGQVVGEIYSRPLDSSNYEGFINKLNASRDIILPGDVVFYDWDLYEEWDHVAIITGWGEVTNHYSAVTPTPGPEHLLSAERPLVTEHSTGFWRRGELPRSIDNVESVTERIAIVHITQ